MRCIDCHICSLDDNTVQVREDYILILCNRCYNKRKRLERLRKSKSRPKTP